MNMSAYAVLDRIYRGVVPTLTHRDWLDSLKMSNNVHLPMYLGYMANIKLASGDKKLTTVLLRFMAQHDIITFGFQHDAVSKQSPE